MDKKLLIIIEAKRIKGLTWDEIASVTENSERCVVIDLFGQTTMSHSEAEKVGNLLGLEKETVDALTQIPIRGTVVLPPTDPLLYRFYEARNK
ncbi:hypothetical protein [Niallia taxi]|uniref:hypothetical protein n=1 Tax=Niallia taxi TaxID=2499688 RepID=UPI003AB280BE